MTAPRIAMPDGKPGPGTVFFVESIFCQIHKIPLAFVRALEHNAVMDSRLARIELEEQIMKTYEIFRADINKSILTIAAADSATAFGAWASAAMLSGFIPFNGGYEYIGDERFSVRPVKAKQFIAEVREK